MRSTIPKNKSAAALAPEVSISTSMTDAPRPSTKSWINSSQDATNADTGIASKHKISRLLFSLSQKYIAKQTSVDRTPNSQKCAALRTNLCEISSDGDIEPNIPLMNSVTDPLISPELSPVCKEFENMNRAQATLNVAKIIGKARFFTLPPQAL